MAGTAHDKPVDAGNQTYDALLTAMETAQARGQTLSRAVIDEARTGQLEVVALARKWADAPTNVFENLGAMLDAQGRAQHRGLALMRNALGDAREFRADVQDAFRRVAAPNDQADEVPQELVHEAYRRVQPDKEAEPEDGGRDQAEPATANVAAGASTNSGEIADS